jgi:D-amino peptidase
MRHLILADLEGISCVFTHEQCSTGTKAWRQAKNYLTSNLNAVIKGICSQDSEAKITVRDLHNQCYNINLKLLDSRVRYIGGPYHKPIIWFGDLKGYDLAYMVGIHARSGSQGFYAHTQCLEFAEVMVNGKPVCEVEITASIIAESFPDHYPIGFVSGEQLAIDQAKESLPWLIGVPIGKKIKKSENKCKIVEENRLLNKFAQETVKRVDNFGIFQFELPLNAKITFYEKRIANKIVKRWNLEKREHSSSITFISRNTYEFILQLVKIMYLTPFFSRFIPLTPLLRPLYRFFAR